MNVLVLYAQCLKLDTSSRHQNAAAHRNRNAGVHLMRPCSLEMYVQAKLMRTGTKLRMLGSTAKLHASLAQPWQATQAIQLHQHSSMTLHALHE